MRSSRGKEVTSVETDRWGTVKTESGGKPCGNGQKVTEDKFDEKD